MADATVIERLSPLDAANLRVEERGAPMHVAALALLGGSPLLDSAGRLRETEIRAHVERRTRAVGRLRQVLVRPPPGLGAPYWVDDPRFDVARHVRVRPVPGDERALLAVCEELLESPLDPSRPRWELILLPGGGRVGLLLRLHHAVADGAAALTLLSALFDVEPSPSVPQLPPFVPMPPPASRADG